MSDSQNIPELIKCCSDNDPTISTPAALGLWNLSKQRDSRSLIADAGALPVLVLLLSMGTAAGKEYAAGALLGIIACDASLRRAVYEAGAVPGLASLLSEGTAAGKECAAGALKNLACDEVCLCYMQETGQGWGVAW